MSQGNLDKIRKRVTSQVGKKATVDTIIYQLSRELGCLGDLIGREFEFVEKSGKVVGFRQKPIKTKQFIALLKEAKEDGERQERITKKNKRKGKHG